MEEERKYCVYCHTNKVNGKKYIGITCQKPEHRWGPEGNGYRRNGCRRFASAIASYGWDGFTHEVLYTGLTCDEAEAEERRLISELNTIYPNGYNLETGGIANRGHSEDTKKRIGEVQRGRKQSKSAIEKRAAAMRGRKRTAEYCAAMKVQQSEKLGVRVQSWDMNGNPDRVFASYAEAARAVNGLQGNVYRAVKNSTAAYGFLWSIYGAPAPVRKIKTYNRRPVRCVETGAVFDSITDAAKFCGRVDGSCIASLLKGSHKGRATAYGYHWEYADAREEVIGQDGH